MSTTTLTAAWHSCASHRAEELVATLAAGLNPERLWEIEAAIDCPRDRDAAWRAVRNLIEYPGTIGVEVYGPILAELRVAAGLYRDARFAHYLWALGRSESSRKAYETALDRAVTR